MSKVYWPLYEVFVRSKQGLSHRHVGSLHAADDQMALLIEADFLVNSFEAHLAPEGIITFRNHVFRSESAISMLNDMWGL